MGEVQDFALKSLLVMDRGAVLLLVVPMLAPSAPADDALVALDVITRVDVADVAEIRQAVRGALDHADPEVRASAIRALATLRDRDALPALERAAVSGDASVSGAAIEAISGLRRDDPAWRERLRRLIHAPKPALRLAAVRSLGVLADEASLPLLISLLDDDSWRVREATGDALYALRAKSAVGPLVEHLERERMRVRAAYVRALRRTTAMPFRDVPRDWQRWWSDARDTFAVPPLSQVESMEARLAQSAANAPTRATFYGIPVQSDHLALVIDISGSMAETDLMASDPAATAAGDRPAPSTKLDVAKREVEQLIERLPEGSALNLIFFNEDVQRWQHGLVPMSRGPAARACAFVRDRRAQGSTNLFDALADALSDPQLDTIYLLSDGNPTVGRIVDPLALRTEIRRRNASRDVRIHVVSIGHDSPLLRHLAEDAGGLYVQR
jgi:HEAT repeat protein